MTDLCDIPTIKEILSRHGFSFSKGLGQNFLVSGRALRAIADAADPGPGDAVFEIGPGMGTLTRELAARARAVAAVELDERLRPVLAETLGDFPNATVYFADFLSLDLRTFAAERLPEGRLIAVSNLPYNITTEAVAAILESGIFSSAALTLQTEAARKLTAVPGSPDWCRLSLLCAHYSRPKRVMTLPPSAFYPRPGVSSAVVRLEIPENPLTPRENAVFLRMARAAFANRRKSLFNNLSSGAFPEFSAEKLKTSMTLAGIGEMARGEELSPTGFYKLIRMLLLP